MKIFVIASNVPHRQDNRPGVTAIHIQVYQFIKAFLDRGETVVFQIVFNSFHKDFLSPDERQELDHLRGLGVEVLEPIYSRQYQKAAPLSFSAKVRYRLRNVFSRTTVEDFYPAVKISDVVCERIRTGADAVFFAASPEGIAATYGFNSVPKVAFQGDIDFNPSYVRMKHPRIFAKSNYNYIVRLLSMPLASLWLAKFRDAHLRLMAGVDVIANATASNVDFYKKCRRLKSIYIGTTWKVPDKFASAQDIQVKAKRPIKIIGHAGSIDRTGSIFGLSFLLKDLAPALNKVMKGLDYQIHIIGGGKIARRLKPFLVQEHIVVRGFVEDLDSELLSSDIFLFLNNAGPHLAAYSRHIIAWSMGLCLIAHANSKKTLPEIKHGQNALVGSTPGELAQAVYLAATDAVLNRKIRRGGRETFKQCFTPAVLAETLTQEMKGLVNKS